MKAAYAKSRAINLITQEQNQNATSNIEKLYNKYFVPKNDCHLLFNVIH